MPFTRIAAVTGANKGIGYGIVRNLALSYPQSHLNNGPLLIYLTARDPTRGQDAVRSLLEDPKLREAKALQSEGGSASLAFRQLDVTSDSSRQDFISFLSEQHPEGIDVFINNAGHALDGLDEDIARRTIETNYYSTLRLTQLVTPLMKAKGRIVNISSMVGSLTRFGPVAPALATRFREAKHVDEISDLMEEFIQSVAKGSLEKDGWPASAYGVSKSGVTGFTRVLAKQMLDEAKTKGDESEAVLLNAVCPGYVNTAMTKGRGGLSIDQGAGTPVHVALGDIGTTTGQFWERKRVSEW